MPLYADGRRRILPALVFGLGVLWHLLRHGRRYDVVHTASFPYFSLLAAAVVRPFAGYRLVVDWHELWTRDYWREYLGAIGGWFGWQVQRLCLRVPQRAFCFSRLVERRLVDEGVHGEVTVLEGQFEGTPAAAPLPAEPVVVFAGRHIPEKNPVAVVPAVAKARETIPELRGEIYGDGPERPKVLRRDRRARARGRRRGARLRRRGGDRGRARARALPRAPLAAGGLRARRGRGAVEGDAGRARPRRGQRCDRARSRRARTGSSPPPRQPEDLAAAIVRVSAGGVDAAGVDARVVQRTQTASLALASSLETVVVAAYAGLERRS